MAYGTLKVDNITFTNGGVDQSITVSGIVQSISGDITATGTIQAATVIGTTTVSGATVTGNVGQFTTVAGGSASFTTVTGTTVTGTTANFGTGVFTTQLSGATVIGTTVSGGTVQGTTISGTTVQGTTVSGTTITGGALTVASGTFTGNSTASAFIPTGSTVPTNGVYLPAANTVGVATNGTGRLFVDASGNVGIGNSGPQDRLSITGGAISFSDTGGAARNISWKNLADNISPVTIRGDSPNGTLTFLTNTLGNAATERVRIDSSGRLLVGTSTARSNYFNTTSTPQHQIEGLGYASITRNLNDIFSPLLVLAKSRSTTNTIVQSGDLLGQISFQGNDGSEFVEAALIRCDIDGTPGANDMPGRLVFSTTADGASTPTERMRITNTGLVTFAGATSSFPALKRNGTVLETRLADDSGFATTSAQLRAQGTAPASTGATGTAGDIRYDADYIYVCTATNTWKRAALSTW